MDFQTRYVFDPKTDLLGKGGFSKVYKATDILLERTVALKFFTAKTSDKYQILNEIKRVIRFEHPNLCKYYDVALLNYKNVLEETEQMEVGIMEYVDAGDFKSYIKKQPQHTDKLLIDVLKGLAYLHKHGMAHRDLKPQNILIKMMDDEPVGKITDFGISKLVDSADDANSSALLGTIEYMAPEQFSPKKYGINGRITTNLDLWSFGLLVYEAVCQQSLFGSRSAGSSAEQVMANILGDMPMEKAETLPPRYREIVKRCLVKNASERVQNALELIPLFQTGNEASGPVPVYAQTDSGKISITETQVLTPPLPITGEVTQTLHPLPETGPVDPKAVKIDEPVAHEPEIMLNNIEQDEPEYMEAMPAFLADENVSPQPADGTEESTQVFEPVSHTAEVTQVMPQPAALRQTQVLEEEPQAEETTQVISRPVVKEEPSYDRLWTKTLNENNRRKAEQKRTTRMILLALTALLLVGVFVAYPLLKSSSTEKPPVPPPQPPKQSRPVVPAFKPPETLSVAGGTFSMGSAAVGPVHAVTLSDFAIGRYEVTIDQFRQFINETGYITTAEQKKSSQVFGNGRWPSKEGVNWRYDVQGVFRDSTIKDLPIVHVSWIDANEYCKWLSTKTGQTYRLPTEAEWEFAAEGGNSTKGFLFSGSNNIDEVAWYDKNASGSVHPVGAKGANEIGIYDMSGNVAEWCSDWYAKDYYKISESQNPTGPDAPPKDRKKILRGGAWGLSKDYCFNTDRVSLEEDSRGGNTGFRVCKSSN